jgi:hypothetical protein
MTPPANPARYKNHRFPGEIISHCVWLYYRFTLSYRDVQELLFERGINVTYEAIRQWCHKFGQDYANQLKRRRPRPGDKWHLEIVFTQLIKTRGLPTGVVEMTYRISTSPLATKTRSIKSSTRVRFCSNVA